MTITGIESTICADCGESYEKDMPEPGQSGASGYATRHSDNARICYDCAARDELREMHETGRAMLYISGDEVVKYKGLGAVPPVCYLENVTVGNWTGRIKFRVTARWYGAHNIAGHRTDVRFLDDQGAEWWGVIYGNNTQIIHCRRLKGRR